VEARVTLTARLIERHAASRCAFCHDELHVAERCRCKRCGVETHLECRLERCPTLGCGGRCAPAIGAVQPRAGGRRAYGYAVTLAIVGLLLVLAGTVGPCFALSVPVCAYALLGGPAIAFMKGRDFTSRMIGAAIAIAAEGALAVVAAGFAAIFPDNPNALGILCSFIALAAPPIEGTIGARLARREPRARS
jgi:hypothetical protein